MKGYNLLDLGYSLFYGVKGLGNLNIRYDVYESSIPEKEKNVEPNNVLAVYTASKILASAISQIPIEVMKGAKPYTESKYYFSLRHRMSDIVNNQVFMSTIQYYLGIYGNAFAKIIGDKFLMVHPALISDVRYNGGVLEYQIAWSKTKKLLGDGAIQFSKDDEWVSANDMLHFKGLSADGIFGLPPVSAAMYSMKILDKASSTIVSFYKNRAMSPMALESTIGTAAAAKSLVEQTDEFNKKYGGNLNSGKTVTLPPNTKLTPLAISYADAQLVETMKFSKDEIFTLYGIPSFMTEAASDKQASIEEQTLSFKSFTIAPIVHSLSEELEYKLLSRKELLDDVHIEFDMDVLVASDLATRANAYKTLVMSGILTPNQAIERMGEEPVDNEWLDKHFVQAQMISLEDYEQNPLMDTQEEDNNKPEEEEDNKDETGNESI